MEAQKKEIIAFVQSQRTQGATITACLNGLGVKRSTYYSWLTKKHRTSKQQMNALTPEEKTAIEQAKEEHPELRHRQLQGILQGRGIYLSFSSVYHHLKALDLIEPYQRRPSPMKEARYNVWQRNLMWGCDWTKLLINHMRWYLLILIDFFSRYVLAYEVYPSINAAHVRHLYARGLKDQKLSRKEMLPQVRVDRGSPNTSLVTQEFFSLIGAPLSFARIRRPTDNALTERFFGTAKQEEIYIVGSYPDEHSAREEIGRYVHRYNYQRPHQSLWNCTPSHIHEANNNTLILEELDDLKEQARSMRRLYWEEKGLCQ
jgi:transposase InsO family protein